MDIAWISHADGTPEGSSAERSPLYRCWATSSLDVQTIEALTEARQRRSYTAHPTVAVSSSGSLCGTTPGLDATHTRETCVGDCPDIGRGKQQDSTARGLTARCQRRLTFRPRDRGGPGETTPAISESTRKGATS